MFLSFLQVQVEELVALMFDLTDNQARKLDLAKLSGRLRGLAHEVSSLSQTQPDLSKRIEKIQQDLKSIGGLLRGIN